MNSRIFHASRPDVANQFVSERTDQQSEGEKS